MTRLNRLSNPINKLEAARRQIDCAVRLYCNDEDIVPVHTLAYAALSVLTSYDKAANKGSSWAKVMREHPCDWSRDIANFLKHADRDPHREIPQFPNIVPEFVLHMCARIYRELAGELTNEMQLIDFLVTIRNKWDKEAEDERENWDSFYDEEFMLEAAEQEELRSQALRQWGRDVLTGKREFLAGK
jgi:hypothetical protein